MATLHNKPDSEDSIDLKQGFLGVFLEGMVVSYGTNIHLITEVIFNDIYLPLKFYCFGRNLSHCVHQVR